MVLRWADRPVAFGGGVLYTHVVKDLRNPATSPFDLLPRRPAEGSRPEPAGEGGPPDGLYDRRGGRMEEAVTSSTPAARLRRTVSARPTSRRRA